MRTPILFAGALVLAACGGGGSDVPDVIEVTDLNIGSTGGVAAETGLAYADGTGQTVPASSTFTFRLARFETDHSTGVTRLVLSDAAYTIANASNILEGTVSINDEMVTLVYDGSAMESFGSLSNGQELGAYINDSGQFVELISLYTYEDPPNQGFDSEGTFAVGFETDPSTMPRTATRVTYMGSLLGFANVVDGNGDLIEQEVQVDGTATFSVNFMDGNIDGQVAIQANGESTIYVDDTLLLAMTNLSGNGFSIDADTLNGCGTCVSNSIVGGAFFGANAEEIGGLVAIDITNDSGTHQVLGAAGFIATE